MSTVATVATAESSTETVPIVPMRRGRPQTLTKARGEKGSYNQISTEEYEQICYNAYDLAQIFTYFSFFILLAVAVLLIIVASFGEDKLNKDVKLAGWIAGGILIVLSLIEMWYHATKDSIVTFKIFVAFNILIFIGTAVLAYFMMEELVNTTNDRTLQIATVAFAFSLIGILMSIFIVAKAVPRKVTYNPTFTIPVLF